jgi:hypothetical protein
MQLNTILATLLILTTQANAEPINALNQSIAIAAARKL